MNQTADTDRREPTGQIAGHPSSSSKEPALIDGGTGLPVPLSVDYPRQTRRRWVRPVLAVVLIVAAAGAAVLYWRAQNESQLSEGIVMGNGRIEADEIDIGTKFAGRVAEILVQEGDMVAAGQAG